MPKRCLQRCRNRCHHQDEYRQCQGAIVATFLHAAAAVIAAQARYNQHCQGTVISTATTVVIIVV
jgi:hypothetical protein